MAVELQIEGMTCGMCERHVREALEEVPGVHAVRVDLAAGRATVEHEVVPQVGAQAIPEAALLQAVSEAGYKTQIVSAPGRERRP